MNPEKRLAQMLRISESASEVVAGIKTLKLGPDPDGDVEYALFLGGVWISPGDEVVAFDEQGDPIDDGEEILMEVPVVAAPCAN